MDIGKKTCIFILVISLCAVFCFTIKSNNVKAALSTSTYGKIHFINVTHPSYNRNADAILIESKGKLCLIDAGNPAKYGSGSGLIDYSGYDGKRVVDYIKGIGGTHIDYIIATHSHSDHIGGIKQVAESSLVNSSTKFYYRKEFGDDPTGKNATEDKYNEDKYGMNNEYFYNMALTAIRKKTSNLIDVTDKNYTITLGNFSLKLLNTESWSNRGYTGTNPNENNNSIAVLATIGSKKALLTSDMGMIDERRLIANGSIGKVDILKLGHHGENSSNSYELIDTTKPNGVIETGRANYPANERNTIIMKYILDKEYTKKIYNTSKIPTGAIIAEFTSNSYKFKVSNSTKTLEETAIKLDYVYSKSWVKIIQEGVSSSYGWYYINPDGKAATGWKKDGAYWYLLGTTNGVMRKGWVGYYYLNENVGSNPPEGAMVTGWLKYKDLWYYMNPSEDDSTFELGECVRGFKKIAGSWYYFYTKSDSETTCAMNTKSQLTIGGKTYKFNSNGVCTNFSGYETKPTTAKYCKSTTYNGSEQTITKTAGTGYTFSNNSQTNAGTYKVTAKLKANYLWSDSTSDNVTFNCAISQANVSNASISTIADIQYTGSAVKPTPTVSITLNGVKRTLVKDTDYTISYSNNTKVGQATLKITGKGNYSGTKSKNFNIVDDSLTFLDTSCMKVTNDKAYINIKTGVSINRNTIFNNIKNSSSKKLYNNNNVEITSSSSSVATGYKISTTNKEYPVVVTGDVNESGRINVNDIVLIYRNIVDSSSFSLTGLKKEAADYDGNGIISNEDLNNIFRLIAK